MVSSINLRMGVIGKTYLKTYHPTQLYIGITSIELEKISPQIMTKIKFELSKKPSKAEKEAQGKLGFVPVRARWIIERSNASRERCKILIKNFEITLANANALR
jgi:Transposase DDE domain